MKPEKRVEQMVRDLHESAGAETHDRVLGHLLEVLRQRTKQPVGEQPAFGRSLMKNPVTRFAAAAVFIAGVVLLANLLIRTTTPAYALGQTVEAMKNIRFLHIVKHDTQGRMVEERWIEVGTDGQQIRYRRSIPPHVLAIKNGQSAARYCHDRRAVVLYDHSQMQYPWIGLFGQAFENLRQEGRIIERNVDYHGRPAHRVWWPVMDAQCYVDAKTKLPIAIGDMELSYEEPPAGTFEITTPEGYAVVDRRLGSADSVPDWLVREERDARGNLEDSENQAADVSTDGDFAGEPRTHKEGANQENVLYATMDLNQDAQSPVKIASEETLIALYPAESHSYQGTLELTILCDSDILLYTSVMVNTLAAIPGDYSCTLSTPEIAAPGDTTMVRLRIEGTGVRRVSSEIRVATVSLHAVRKRDVPKLWLQRGFAAYDTRSYEEALGAFETIETLDQSSQEDRATALIWRGHMLDLLGRRDEAIAEYRKVVEMGLDSGVHHDAYGLAYEYTPYATERMTTPFTRVERKP